MTDLRDVFADGDYELVVEALYGLRERKQAALSEAGKHPATAMFTAQDFGIPKIDAILQRLDAEPSAAVASQMEKDVARRQIQSGNTRIFGRVEDPTETFELVEALGIDGSVAKFKHVVADAVAYAADGKLKALQGLVLGDVFQHALPEALSAPGHIGIRLEGGVVQSVFTDRPMDVVVIDHDTQGCDEEDLFDLSQDGGRIEKCFVQEYAAAVMPSECQRIRDALDARDAALESEPDGAAP